MTDIVKTIDNGKNVMYVKRRLLKKGKIFDNREIAKKGIEIGHEIGKTNRYQVTDIVKTIDNGRNVVYMKRRLLKKEKIFDNREIPKKGIEIGHEIGKTNRYQVTDIVKTIDNGRNVVYE